MYKRAIFPLLVIMLLSFSYILFANDHTIGLDLSTWTPYTANGSYIKSVTSNEATFVMLRVNSGPKTDVSTHGYAYLLSNPINIGNDWGKVTIEGAWWKEGKRKNYQEMSIYVFSKKPKWPHGRSKDGEILTNFLYIGYDEWNRVIKFTDMGDKRETATNKTLSRILPKTPRKFRIVLRSFYPRGEFTWEYWEKDSNGEWEKLYTQEISHLFDGLTYPFNKIYIKIGGWVTYEFPIPTRIHFKDLSMEKYTQLEIQEGIEKEEQQYHEEQEQQETQTTCPPRPEGIENIILNHLPAADGHIIPIGPSYRGACGGGKPSTAIDQPDVGIIVPYPPGSNCYYLVLYENVVKAGTHLGCRFHDTCFDICKHEHGETSEAENYIGPCHDVCSGVVVEVYGAENGASWMQGGGPYDDMLLFWGKRKVLGPYNSTTFPISELKARNIIKQNTIVHSLPSHPQKSLYMIEVWTGDKLFAGTDANIYIELHDKNGRSSGVIDLPHAPITRESLLDAITSNTLSMFSGEGFKNSGFERGNHEKYYFLWGDYVENIDYIKLWRDNSGPAPDWYCKKIKVYREKWNSFDTIEELGEININKWVGTSRKKYNAK